MPLSIAVSFFEVKIDATHAGYWRAGTLRVYSQRFVREESESQDLFLTNQGTK